MPPQIPSTSYMGDPSQMMAGLTPAFMNQPQYQQQMQGLAMQVRQQEEGTKKIKKFLKAYEDIQLTAPMQPQQAPQQPGFMQPPGGAVQSMNNNLPRNEPQYEDAPTSFTEMAGGSIPEGEDDMTSYSEAPIGAEEAGYSNTSDEGGSTPKPSVPSRDKSEDKYPLEQRGDWDASRKSRQENLKKVSNQEASFGKGRAMGKLENQAQAERLNIIDLERRIQYLERDITKTGPNIETDPRTGKTYPMPGYSQEQIAKKKEQIAEAKAAIADAKKKIETANKKYELARKSKPNKAFGIAGGLLAGTAAAGAATFPPEDAEIFLGRISADKDFNRLNEREKAAVQKFLEYKAESDSIDARVDVPKGRSGRMDEPIEYTSAEKLMRSQ